MEILNASLRDMADTFLHPGYMSAYVEVTAPVAMTAAVVPVDKEPVLQDDMAKALLLTESLRDPVGVAPAPAQQQGASPTFPWVGFVVLVVALLTAERLARRARPLRRAPRLLSAVTALALVVVGACGQGSTPETIAPEKPPADQARDGPTHEDKHFAPYEDPRQATIAILNGIVADALACSRARDITSLADVSRQVGLPFTNKTGGMRYAIANFADDGWGRPFRFRAEAKTRFEVTSAGDDAVFDTTDDITLNVTKPGQYDWPSKLRAFYLRRERSDVGVSFHRCGPEGTRRIHIQPTARGLIGDALYGVIPEQEFPAAKQSAIRTRLGNVKDGIERDALVLLVFDPKHMGRAALRKIMVPDW
jgi:hypothetical protein